MDDKPRQLPSSYRDPSGFVFAHDKEIYRQVNRVFKDDFDFFLSSGLYQSLVDENLLIPHQTIEQNFTNDDNWLMTLKPDQLRFVSYPYEWTFSVLKEAALLTLSLAQKALAKGMMLKDASPYNVQWHKGRMIFIDTLSFERYKEGEPWIAYRQFCENFLAPLALMHYTGMPVLNLFTAHPNGFPLPLVSKVLPFKSRLNVHLYLHLHLHASVSAKAAKPGTAKLSKQKLIHLFSGLESLVRSFRFDHFENVWGRYYEEAGTRPGYMEEKKAVIESWSAQLDDAKTVIDIGGNQGEFSELVAKPDRFIICADGEHFAVDSFYQKLKQNGIKNILPLCIDFTNPSPALCANNKERFSFLQRASSDLAMALALIHHLCIGRNWSFSMAADLCAQVGQFLIIEFVAKEDEKVQLLLAHKKDIYTSYTIESFEQAFSERFEIIEKRKLASAPRTLYLMKRL